MRKTIFVSSTFRDLASHRKAVWGLLEEFDVSVRGMEEFGARTETPLDNVPIGDGRNPSPCRRGLFSRAWPLLPFANEISQERGLHYAYNVYIMATCASSTIRRRLRQMSRSMAFRLPMRKVCLRIRLRSPSRTRTPKANNAS